MHLYVPSMSRATSANLTMGPLTRIPEDYRDRTHLVVPRGEGDAYQSALGAYSARISDLSWVRVLETPPGMRGIGPTRHWMGVHAEAVGAPSFLMMDDDIDFLVRKSPQDWSLRAQREDESLQMLQTIEKWLELVGMVGISDRAGNNRCGVGGPSDPNMVARDTRIMRMFAVRTAEWLSMRHGDIDVMEDFSLTLQFLEAGLGNVNLFYWANGQKMTNMAGGCSTYRTHEVQDRAARRLQEIFGQDIVRLRQKQNKTDAQGLGSRTEVTIAWKSMAKRGEHKRAAAE